MKTYLNGWTKETVIEHVKANFKGRSWKNESSILGFCAYRGDHNRKCIAGCFINDDDYSPMMEQENINELLVKYPEITKTMPFNSGTMKAWQSIHDSLNKFDSVEEQTTILLKFLDDN